MRASAAELLANVVLVLHACLAVFVVAGLLVTVLGHVLRWRWVTNVWFRLAHAAAIAAVVAEAWVGIACPLTLLERSLRVRAGVATYRGGFIEHWIGGLLYYQAPPWVFVMAYSIFGVLVAAVWWYVPPRRPGQHPSAAATSPRASHAHD